MKPSQFSPDRDIPSLAGKTILITGGTAGVGSQTVFELYKHGPKHIVFTGRNQKSANDVIKKCKEWSNAVPSSSQSTDSIAELTFVAMDMTDLAAVAQASHVILETVDGQIDIAILNAGVMAIAAGLSKDGYEIQFAINHMAHALLALKILPVIDASHGRLLSITSEGYKLHPSSGIDFESLNTMQTGAFGAWRRYGQSKLANILFGREIARRYPNITSVMVHPGVSYTGLVTSLPLGKRIFIYATTFSQYLSEEQGAYNHLWASTSTQVQSGQMYEPVGNLHKMDSKAKDDALALQLWEWTSNELASHL